jgi:dienelactone hydrolase
MKTRQDFQHKIVFILVILGVLFPVFADDREKVDPGSLLEISFTGIVKKDNVRLEGFPFFKNYIIPTAHYDVEAYKIVYKSTDVDGSSAEITAQLFVPVYEEETERPVYVFGSGTTGVADQCAPSLEQPEIRVLGHYRGYTMSFAGLGYISLIPDYLGFNDPDRPQRYFSKVAEAHVMLDAVRAVYNFFKTEEICSRSDSLYPSRVKPSRDVFLSGYSQGGHAAFAAADLRNRYAPEVPITGVIGYGSTTNVATLFKEGPRFAPHVLYSYSKIYEDINPADYLQDCWAETLAEDTATMCVDDFLQYYPRDAAELYRPDFYYALYNNLLAEQYPELHRRLEQNNSGLSGHGIPALLVQGALDSIIHTPSQSEFALKLCERGSSVRFITFDDVYHRYTRAAGFQAAVLWMNRLSRREEAESDCSLLQ